MQYNTPPRRPARTAASTPVRQRQRRDYRPRKRKNKALSVVPLLALFVVLLAAMYFIFPKQAGRHVGSTIYDGLVISEVMAANNSAVPDENGEFHDWLQLYNGTGYSGICINDCCRNQIPSRSELFQALASAVRIPSASYDAGGFCETCIADTATLR